MKRNMIQKVFFLGILLIQQCVTAQASENDEKQLLFQQIQQLQELLKDLRDSYYLENQQSIMNVVNNALSQMPTPDISSYSVDQLDRFKDRKKAALKEVETFLKGNDATGNVFMIIRIQNVLNALKSNSAEPSQEPSNRSESGRKPKASSDEGLSIDMNKLQSALRKLPVAPAPTFPQEKGNAKTIADAAQQVEDLFEQAAQDKQAMFEKQLLDIVQQQTEAELAQLQQEYQQSLAALKEQEQQAFQELQKSAATISERRMNKELHETIGKMNESIDQTIFEMEQSTDDLMKVVGQTQSLDLEEANKAQLEKERESIANMRPNSRFGEKIIEAALKNIEATQAQLQQLEVEARKAKISVNSAQVTVRELQEKLFEKLQKALEKNSAELLQILKDLEVSRVTSDTLKQVFDALKVAIHGFKSAHNQSYIQGYLQGLLIAHGTKSVSYVAQLNEKEVEKLLRLLKRVQSVGLRA